MPNKYPQLELGKIIIKHLQVIFIFMKNDEFLLLTNNWKSYIETQLMKIVKNLNIIRRKYIFLSSLF